ncbi:MAG: dihydropteridine reductase [Clostridia bacterium]|nr:dihydropteridine reductase [Clostridia bacterium]
MNTNDKQFMAQKIRAQYVEKEEGELDELRALDKSVKRPARIFAYTFGTIGALALGTGMSLAMKVIGDSMLAGVVIGCVGIAMVSTTYAIYNKILARRRQRNADKVLELSDKIINK